MKSFLKKVHDKIIKPAIGLVIIISVTIGIFVLIFSVVYVAALLCGWLWGIAV